MAVARFTAVSASSDNRMTVGPAPCCSTARNAAAPVAKSINVSEVDVSLSTVIALKEVVTPFESIACSTGAAMGASVKT